MSVPEMLSLADAAARVNMKPRQLVAALQRDGVGVYFFNRRARSVKLEEFTSWIERRRRDGSEQLGQGTLKRVRPSGRRRTA